MGVGCRAQRECDIHEAAHLLRAAGVLYGIKPVVIAIVAQALWILGPKALKKSRWLGTLGAVACSAAVLNVDGLAVLLGAGATSMLGQAAVRRRDTTKSLMLLAPITGTTAAPAATLVDRLCVVLAVASALLLARFKVNSTWLIATGALVGAVAKGLP